ncbi:MAG: pyridoxal phosphate-dependent decarboxylase family protein [Geminicoccaceae bacterium]
MIDPDFEAKADDLQAAIAWLIAPPACTPASALPSALPETGLGAGPALERLAPIVLGGGQRLGGPVALAHMDPPTPWVTWASALWNASLNQNLLHPDLASVARELEARVIDWIAPAFGMTGGHMTPGSTISNLTALWAARELASVRRVVASAGAHLSVAKSAHLLGLAYTPIGQSGRPLVDTDLPDDLSDAALVLTAGATGTGAIDALSLAGRAAWTHVDAAWSGPLRFSDRHRHLLDGIEAAQSLAVSAHKWLFQPKEAGLVLFRDVAAAHDAVSFAGAYLTTANVGVLGSHGANAIPLLATLLAWGRQGLAARIDNAMELVERLHESLCQDARVIVFGPPQSGVLLWRPKQAAPEELQKRLPRGLASVTAIDGQRWLRQVGANPMADIDAIVAAIDQALSGPC